MFLSRFDNKVDKKGRVSVPAAWRALLAKQAFNGIVVFPSPNSDAIDGCGMDRMEQLSASIDTLNPFSEQRDAFARAIMSASYPLQFDSDGRVMLPEPLLRHAGIVDLATFAGLGPTFQIWQPEKFAAKQAADFERARSEAAELRLPERTGGSSV